MRVAFILAVVLAGGAGSGPTSTLRAVTGVVLDESGRPVPDALVTWMSSTDGTFDVWDAPIPSEPGGGIVRTDARGRYTLPVPRGHAAVVAVRSGEAITVRVERVEAEDRDAEVRIRFDGTKSLAGRAVDVKGRPLAGIRVTALPERTSPAAAAGHGIAVRGWTRDDGSFVLQGLAPGPHRVKARGPGFHCVEHCEYGEGMRVTAGDQNVTVALEAIGSVRGRVVRRDAAGVLRPVPRFVVTSAAFERVEVSSPEGAFDIDVPRLWEKAPILVVADGLVPFASRFDLIEPIALDLGDIELGTGRVIRGQVRDGSGAPVAGATVAVGSARLSLGAVRTDARGAFAIRVQHQQAPLIISHPKYRLTEVVAEPSTDDLEVQLESGAVLRLRVVDVNGTAIGGAWVRDITSHTGCTTDDDGRCALTGLERKSHVLEFGLAGASRPRPRQIRIPVPALAAPVTLRLPIKPSVLRVVAVAADGTFADAWVKVIPGDVSPEAIAKAGDEPAWPYYPGGMDVENVYENVPPGRYTVVAKSDDGRCAAPVIDVVEGENKITVKLPRQPGGCSR